MKGIRDDIVSWPVRHSSVERARVPVMAVPSEIRKLLDADPEAHAALGCGLQGPVGETHLLAVGGRVVAFTRDSLIGEFTRVELAAIPDLERGDFADTLRLQLADGSDAELNVSSFERDAVVSLLDTAASPAPEQETPRPAVVEPADREPPRVALPPPRPERSKPQQPVDFPQEPAPEASGEPEPEKEKPDKQAGREVAVYHSSDPGCFGCVAYLVVFSGTLVGFWYLHIEAARTVGMIGPSETEQDSFGFIATKVLALVAGAYMGGRLIQLVNRALCGLGLIGRVMFSQSVIQVFGPAAKWHVMFSTPLPIEVSLRCHRKFEESEASSDKPGKLVFNYYLTLSQHNQTVQLKTSKHATAPQHEIAGIPVIAADEEPKSDRQLGFEYQTFKHVARRIARVR
ncbi:MAG: hypothetical protein H6841_03685 [Planctomycetes bacterium]|nr:hypothetical protein [Planctomycetota bacterium]